MWFNYCYGYNNPFMNLQFNNYFSPSQNIFSPFINSFLPEQIFFREFTNMHRINYRHNNDHIFNNKHTVSLEDSLVIKQVEDKKFEKKPVKLKEELTYGVKYNKNKGELLAKNVLEGLPEYRDPENPLCARYVKNAIVKSGLGPYINGNGEYCKYILRANDNFKEVKVKGNELKNLPAGAIIVYDAFSPCIDAQGKPNKIGKDGHVLIMLKDGKGCSDIIEDKIAISDNAYVFIPV